MSRPGISWVEISGPRPEVEVIANGHPARAVDIDMHRRGPTGIAGCGIPAKQEQLTDDGGLVTCRRPGCGGPRP